MKQLPKDWLTRGLLDFEYKQYVLLAYLKDVKAHFDDAKLYPQLSDLVMHYQNLQALKENKTLMLENFPKEISKADFEALKIHYKQIVEDDEVMQQIEEIIAYALPQFKRLLEEGKDLYEHIEKHLAIYPIGITPLKTDEGYFMLNEPDKRELPIYAYQVSIFEHSQETYRALNVRFVQSVVKSIGKTFENIKLDLIQRYQSLPNPATYLINATISSPLDETLLPIAKRRLIRHLEV